jgi:hypothetical protein
MASTSPVSSVLIDRWTIKGKQVSLFRCKDKDELESLKFSVKEGDRQIGGDTIAPYLYPNTRRTCAIVSLFHDVINVNLLSSIEPSSFVPVLETRAWINKAGEVVSLKDLKVALFGRADPETDVLHEARWGIYDQSDGSCKVYEIPKIEGAIRECLLNALCHRLNATYFAERFRVEVTLDSNNKVTSLALIVLNRLSLFDKNVVLDEERWAITLVSAQPGSTSIIESISLDWRSGHAMIACEGIKDGCQFFKYLHLTKNKSDQCLEGAPARARIKIKREFVTNTLNGPTWIRTRTVVESLLYSIQEADKHCVTVPFAMGRKVPALAAPFVVKGSVAISIMALFTSIIALRYGYKIFALLSSPKLDIGQQMGQMQYFLALGNLLIDKTKGKSLPPLPLMFRFILIMSRIFPSLTSRLMIMKPRISVALKESRDVLHDLRFYSSIVALATTSIGAFALKRLAKRYDCLQWTLEQLPEAGIVFKLPWTVITPNAAVEYLNKHSEIITLEGTDSALRNPKK